MSEVFGTPHGGELVSLLVDPERSKILKELSRDLKSLTLSRQRVADLELLMNGAFSPLRGFMRNTDYESVLDRMRLQNGLLWPMPVSLDISEAEAGCLEPGQSIALRDSEGFMLAVMHIEDLWEIDKTKEAELIYGTQDRAHPGVDFLFSSVGTHYIGGPIEGLQLPIHSAFKRHRHTPIELRALFKKLGWRRIVGFQTRNPLHRAQFEMTIRAMGAAKANLLLHPVALRAKPGDIDYYTRIHCYLAVSKHYPPNMMLLSLLPLAMRMAGPREALWHAIIRKNYGCTHFIVGRNHACPGQRDDGSFFYPPEAAKDLAQAYSEELDIGIIPFEKWSMWWMRISTCRSVRSHRRVRCVFYRMTPSIKSLEQVAVFRNGLLFRKLLMPSRKPTRQDINKVLPYSSRDFPVPESQPSLVSSMLDFSKWQVVR